MTTPNNSDQAAMLPCPWCGESLGQPVMVSEGSTFRWRKVDGCCTDGPEIRHNTMADDQAAAEVESHAKAVAAWNRRAALTLPASEAVGARPVAFEHQFAEGRNALSYIEGDERVGENPHRIRPLVYATPPPAPAAHAGGEVAERNEAAGIGSDGLPFSPYIISEWAGPDMKDRKVWTAYSAEQMRAYRAASPMPVDALLALLPDKKPYNTGGRTNAETGEWNMCRAEMERRITALLSGGAAREGAPDLMALHDETMRQLRGETK